MDTRHSGLFSNRWWLFGYHLFFLAILSQEDPGNLGLLPVYALALLLLPTGVFLIESALTVGNLCLAAFQSFVIGAGACHILQLPISALDSGLWFVGMHFYAIGIFRIWPVRSDREEWIRALVMTWPGLCFGCWFLSL